MEGHIWISEPCGHKLSMMQWTCKKCGLSHVLIPGHEYILSRLSPVIIGDGSWYENCEAYLCHQVLNS